VFQKCEYVFLEVLPTSVGIKKRELPLVSSNLSTMAGRDTQLTQKLTLAGIHVNRSLLLRFAESFNRCDVTIHTVPLQAGQSNQNRKINACVLPLNEIAVGWLKKSSWFLPRRTMIYGIGGLKELTRFVDLGINVLLETGSYLSIQAAVAATQPLLSRGIGTCTRVPIAMPVKIEAEGRVLAGITKNVGSSGMAVRLFRNVAIPQNVALSFVLPGAGLLSLSASPRWYSGRLVGLRFQPSVHGKTLSQWVHEYSLLGCGGQRPSPN
jgi:hypothetical protein